LIYEKNKEIYDKELEIYENIYGKVKKESQSKKKSKVVESSDEE